LREGRGRACHRDGPTAASPAAERALRGGARGAERPDAGRGDGASAEDAAGPSALRLAQTDPGAGVRHHQICARIPSIFTARARKRARRVEPRDHGLEFEADVHPRSDLSNGLSRLAPKMDIRSRSNCINANPPRLRSQSIQAANSKIDIATQSQTTQSDRLLAYMWLILATAQEPNAVRERDVAASQMTADEIAQAQRLAREWKPTAPSP